VPSAEGPVKIGAKRVTHWGLELMDYTVSYEHSLKSDPDKFIVHVPTQLVEDVPANVPRALLPEYISELILKRSPQMGKIRHLRII
jgi:hypothetical protein